MPDPSLTAPSATPASPAPPAAPALSDAERRQRWRLILGGGAADGIGCALGGDFQVMDQALASLYETADAKGKSGAKRLGGTGGSSPQVARWLGDIRRFFPSSVVRVMQHDAMERLGLRQMLLEPETLATLEADVHLVSTLLSLQSVIPAKTKDTARMVVRKVVDELMKRLEAPMKAPSPAASTAPRAPAGRATPTSTGPAPSAPT